MIFMMHLAGSLERRIPCQEMLSLEGLSHREFGPMHPRVARMFPM